MHIRGKIVLVLDPVALPHGPGCMWITTYSSQKADCYRNKGQESNSWNLLRYNILYKSMYVNYLKRKDFDLQTLSISE